MISTIAIFYCLSGR